MSELVNDFGHLVMKSMLQLVSQDTLSSLITIQSQMKKEL